MPVFFFFFFFFSSGPRAYAPDAPQPIDLLCNPSIVQTVPKFAASPPSRPCYPRDPWQWRVELLRGRETWLTILPKMHDFHGTVRDLLHAVNVRHGTDGFTSPPKEGALRIFSPWKIRRLRPGLNPRTWVPKASTLPLDHRSRSHAYQFLLLIPKLSWIVMPFMLSLNMKNAKEISTVWFMSSISRRSWCWPFWSLPPQTWRHTIIFWEGTQGEDSVTPTDMPIVSSRDLQLTTDFEQQRQGWNTSILDIP